MAAGAGASACCLDLLDTNPSLSPALWVYQQASLGSWWWYLCCPCLVREGPAAKPCLPRLFSPPAGHNLRAGLLKGRVDKATLGSLEGVGPQAFVSAMWDLWGGCSWSYKTA